MDTGEKLTEYQSYRALRGDGGGAHEGIINIRHFGSQCRGKLETKDLVVTTRERVGVERSDSKAEENWLWVRDV
jgi:hypothetical protein